MAAIVETVTGVMGTVKFHRNGFLIAKLEDGTSIKGTCLDPQFGATYTLFGTWEHDPKWGAQFRFNDYEVAAPLENNAIAKYLVANAKWIGEATAKAIVEQYGANTLDVLKADPQRVAAEVSGLTVKRALEVQSMLKAKESWERTAVGLNEVFAGTGLGRAIINRVIECYGHSALDTIRDNPFCLVDDIRGVGFHGADKVRANLGISALDPQRIRAGIRHVLHEAAWGDGHTFLPSDEFLTRVTDLKILGVPRETVEAELEAMQALDLIFIERTPTGYNIALSKIRADEEDIREKIELLAAWRAQPLTPNVEGLAADQIEAITRAATENLFIITGAPGVGKTHMLKRLIQSFPPHARIALTAPTGKAAKRMTEQTGMAASTIHRLLEPIVMDGEFHFQRDEKFPLQYDAIIVDETSMLDVSLGASLLRAITQNTRVVFVGDVHQLPSVGPGNVLRDMIDSGHVPTCELTIIKRQAENALIVSNCHAIKNGDNIVIRNNPKDDFFWIEVNEIDQIATTIVDLVKTRLTNFYGAHPLRDIQVISPFRERGDASCKALNTLLQGALNPNPEIENHRFRVGDKMIQTKNDYELDIINGDIGYMLEVDTDSKQYVVRFEEPDRIVRIPFKGHDLELAYALTCHRFQGSEARIIIIPIHKSQGPLIMQNNWIYTAISRGREVVCCVGQKAEVPKIIKRRNQQRRWTSLGALIRGDGPAAVIGAQYPDASFLIPTTIAQHR